MKKLILLLLVALFATSCATTSRELYYWGEYENSLYEAWSNPGEMPIEKQIENLEADIEKAKSADRNMPPGWHLHLGVLYYQLGNEKLAMNQFEIEKNSFPESQTLIKTFLKN